MIKATFSSIKKFGLFLIMLLLLTSLTLTGCQQEKVLKIGYITEQTGVDAYVGPASIPALKDHVDKINAEGGIGGYKLELIVYDTRSEVTDAVAVTKRLIDQDKVVAIIGPSWSAAGIPIADIADAAKIPIVATTASNVNVTVSESGQLHPYMFRVCFIDPYQGYAQADFAYNKLGIRKAALLTDVASPYTVGLHQFFKDHFTELGGEIVAEEGYNQGDTEFRAQLAKIKESGAELLVMSAYTYKDVGLAAQQAEALGLKIRFMSGDGVFVPELLEMAGPQLEGAIVTTGVSENAPEFAEFNAAFEAKHGVKANVYTYYGLDALMAIEYAIREAVKKGEPTPTAIRDALETMKDVQLFTSKVTMDPATHNPLNKPLLINTIQNSQWVLLETFQPK
ncbi:MAG: ABC transporter substrate-binding protein [Anaerolineae bacterium]|nr:MAG: ABC transporter substrate-binding protein [Anaerolineae bacterium]